MISRITDTALLGAITMPAVTPGGSDQQLQYNENGTFGGVPNSNMTLSSGCIRMPASRFPSLQVNTLAQINSVDIAAEHGLSVSAAGSPGVIGPMVCQPFIRDTGAGTSLGSVVNWAAAYAADGTYLGKFPIYDNIT